MHSRALSILVFVLAAIGTLSGQTRSGSDPSGMRRHYDAAYRLQSSGDIARADDEHKRFLASALDHLANFYANTGDYLRATFHTRSDDARRYGRCILSKMGPSEEPGRSRK